MLTDKDIDRIMAVMASKQDVRNLEDRMVRVEDTLGRVVTGLDRLATAVENINFENAATDAKLSRHDRWVHELAAKTQVKLVA